MSAPSSVRRELWTGPGALRLLLAAAVVVHHSTPFYLGPWAVFVFFILSGYWISRMYRETYLGCRSPVVTFYASRWLRLFPVMALAIALDVAAHLSLEGGASLAAHAIADPRWWIAMVTIGACTAAPMFPYTIWTLAIEFQFYLCAPLLLPALRKLGSRLGWVVVAVLAVELVFLPVNRDGELGWLVHYVGLFLLGVWIDQARWRPSLRFALAAAAVWPVLFGICVLHPSLRDVALAGASFSGPMHLYSPALSLVGALAMAPYVAYTVAQRSTPLDRHLGNLAYPLYLVHLVPLEAALLWFGYLPPLERLPYILGCWVATAIATVAIYWLYDLPIDRWRKSWVRSRSAARAPRATLSSPSLATAGVGSEAREAG